MRVAVAQSQADIWHAYTALTVAARHACTEAGVGRDASTVAGLGERGPWSGVAGPCST